MSICYTRGQTIAVTTVASFAALFIGLAVGKGSLDGIKEWQPTLGALGTVAAVIVAVWNVRRQLRMNLITREESYMEEHFPGLVEAFTMLTILNIRLARDDVNETLPKLLHEYDVRGARDVIQASLGKRLPLTDRTTIFQITSIFSGLNFAANLIEEGTSEVMDRDEDPDDVVLENAAGKIAQGHEAIDRARASLSRLETSLGTRLKDWTDRMPEFRDEIEAYFER